MGLALRHRETDSQGSFVAWGVGLKYNYNAANGTLRISDEKRKTAFLDITLNRFLLQNPLAYVRAVEKATQINALMFSNNKNIDLSDIFEETRLIPLLEACALLAKHSLDLIHGRFDHFEYSFSEIFEIKYLRLEKHVRAGAGASLYAGELKTMNNNTIQASSLCLHKVIGNLSEQILRDLVSKELSHRTEKAVHNLLSAASNLAIIGKVLDENFDPGRVVKPVYTTKDATENRTTA